MKRLTREEIRQVLGEVAIRPDVDGGIELVALARRVVRHAVPDDVVHAVGEQRTQKVREYHRVGDVADGGAVHVHIPAGHRADDAGDDSVYLLQAGDLFQTFNTGKNPGIEAAHLQALGKLLCTVMMAHRSILRLPVQALLLERVDIGICG